MAFSIGMWQRHDYKKTAVNEVAAPFGPSVEPMPNAKIPQGKNVYNAKITKGHIDAGPTERKDPDRVIMDKMNEAMMKVIKRA
jgi:hypothetical protein